MIPKLREDRPGRGSDHTSFISQAHPAVRFMETFECSPSPVDNSCGGPFPCPPPANIPAFCKDTSFITTHQHSPNDLVQYITPRYAARIAQVMASVAASLARAPGAPTEFNASGNAVQAVRVRFDEPEGGRVHHFVVAARSGNENFYRQRIVISENGGSRLISPPTLGLNSGDSFYVSVAAVDRQGHESLFAYPEVRCDGSSCAIPPYAFDLTARLPMPPPASDRFGGRLTTSPWEEASLLHSSSYRRRLVLVPGLGVDFASTSPGASTRRTIGVFSLYLRSATLPASSLTRRINTGRSPSLPKSSCVTVTGNTPFRFRSR
jgi:hypothetical protein